MQRGVRDQAMPSEPIARRPAQFGGWPLVLIVGVAAATRLWHLGGKSAWLDEAASIAIARWNLHSVWQAAHQPPSAALFYWYQSLYYFLLHFWLRLGDSELLVRLPSAIFGIATVIVLYAVAARIFSSRVAWIACLLLAVHPF